MNKTLIVGCSFVHDLTHQSDGIINRDHYHIKGSSGAGNQSIAARVVHECSLQPFEEVVVLWSGVNRLDFPIGFDLHDALPKDRDGYPVYPYWLRNDQAVWYHSGGYRLSGTSDPCPKFFKEFFENQYRSANPRYLSEMTLLSIVQTQSFLTAKNIPYKMSFIYDVDHGYTETHIEPGCGKLDRQSSLNSMVDWSKFTAQTPPFEYARNRQGLEPDNFHPRLDAMLDWFKTQLAIDLTS